MKYVVGNWKMNMSEDQVEQWFAEFSKLTSELTFKTKMIIAPSFVHLEKVRNLSANLNIECAAQNVSCHQKGTYTGQVAAYQVAAYCDYSIIGHSERKENVEAIAQKLQRCMENKIMPIVCFTDIEHAKKYLEINKDIILAFEDPVNISQGGVYNPMNIEEIKGVFKKLKLELGNETQIIYGGSTNRDIIGDLSLIEEISGVLPGNASLDPKHYLDLVTAFEK